MASSQFVEAIGLYTMAIKMSSENAVYYSNRYNCVLLASACFIVLSIVKGFL
jgi:hypothetical protein